ncbi:hypothetical protein HOY80DRAFT_1044656 [Tuber brumale]|nr:hypothetical protein HOY80DRAFT_1044656 [Tuber brumale]
MTEHFDQSDEAIQRFIGEFIAGDALQVGRHPHATHALDGTTLGPVEERLEALEERVGDLEERLVRIITYLERLGRRSTEVSGTLNASNGRAPAASAS